MAREQVTIVGAGVAGLTAAVELSAHGLDVTVLEAAPSPGGKMRETRIGEAAIDAGPTVLTMRWVFDELFAAAGASFEAAVPLTPAEVLARHAWGPEERFDLFADIERSADAVGEFAGAAEARRYVDFCRRAEQVYQTLEGPFIRAARPSPMGLVRGVGLARLPQLWQIRPFATLWRALGDYFHDPRLRQLFGRYATYLGSSPFRAAATLMLVAHVEREGVWLVDGGMHRIATALSELAVRHGARIRFGARVDHIETAGGRVCGVRLDSGERIAATAVVSNADCAALVQGRFGEGVKRSVRAKATAPRSLSAVTWAVHGPTSGFPLERHNVFFCSDYRLEFEDIFARARLPRDPTVYVCAQDRPLNDPTTAAGERAERLLCLVNAPAIGDRHEFGSEEIESCEERTFDSLARCGLNVTRTPENHVVTTPSDFEASYPGTGGALYGPASHGWQASFRRPGSRTRVPGLYVAGGSTHPGPGVPMAALAGRAATAAVLQDLASTSPSRPAATAGGTPTP